MYGGTGIAQSRYSCLIPKEFARTHAWHIAVILVLRTWAIWGKDRRLAAVLGHVCCGVHDPRRLPHVSWPRISKMFVTSVVSGLPVLLTQLAYI